MGGPGSGRKRVWANDRERRNHNKRVYYDRHRKRLVTKQAMYDLNKRLVKFGVTADVFGRGCQACGSDKNLCLDHDHKTGKFRGVLCRSCNLALGYSKDCAATLRALALYIEESV